MTNGTPFGWQLELLRAPGSPVAMNRKGHGLEHIDRYEASIEGDIVSLWSVDKYHCCDPIGLAIQPASSGPVQALKLGGRQTQRR
jgi:hypothetical protein